MTDKTIKFSSISAQNLNTKEIMQKVYVALAENGYDPVSQIVGYILSEDPTYITSHNNSRELIRRDDRDELLQELVKTYLEVK